MSAVRDIDRGLRRFVRRARGLDDVAVTVGVHDEDGDQAHPSGGTVAVVAAVSELGTDSRAPAGWLRTTVDTQRASIAHGLAEGGARVLAGEEPLAAFADVAVAVRDQMRAAVPVDTETLREAVGARVDGARVE